MSETKRRMTRKCSELSWEGGRKNRFEVQGESGSDESKGQCKSFVCEDPSVIGEPEDSSLSSSMTLRA